MSIKELMRQYFSDEIDAISVIRILSGMFDPAQATNLLTLICTITRHEQGDIDTETFNEVWKFGIDLEFNKGEYPKHYDNMDIDTIKTILEKMQSFKENNDPGELENPEEETQTDKDISLLISYVLHRERKAKREEKEDVSDK